MRWKCSLGMIVWGAAQQAQGSLRASSSSSSMNCLVVWWQRCCVYIVSKHQIENPVSYIAGPRHNRPSFSGRVFCGVRSASIPSLGLDLAKTSSRLSHLKNSKHECCASSPDRLFSLAAAKPNAQKCCRKVHLVRTNLSGDHSARKG